MNKSMQLLVPVLFLTGCLAESTLQRTVMHALDDSAGGVAYDSSSCATCYRRTAPRLALRSGAYDIQPAVARVSSIGSLDGSLSNIGRVVASTVLATVRPGYEARPRAVTTSAVAPAPGAAGFGATGESRPVPGAHGPLRLKLDTELASLHALAPRVQPNRLLQ